MIRASQGLVVKIATKIESKAASQLPTARPVTNVMLFESEK